jgi:hypothetical protein
MPPVEHTSLASTDTPLPGGDLQFAHRIDAENSTKQTRRLVLVVARFRSARSAL